MEKPEKLKEEHLIFLDNLRDSGITNMFGSAPYILKEYPDINDEDAIEIVKYWMKTYSERHKMIRVSLGDILDRIESKI